MPSLSLFSLPALPSVACTPAAAALGRAGPATVCTNPAPGNGVLGGVTSAAGGAVSDVVGSLVGSGVSSVLGGVGEWVTGGAAWLLGQLGGVLGSSTSIDLGAPWFGAHYATMAALAGVVVVPLLLLGIIQSVYRQSAGMLIRSALVHVPLSLVLTGVAVSLVRTGIAVTDWMCTAIAKGSGTDAGHVLAGVAGALAPTSALAGQPSAPSFVVFLGGIVLVFGALMVWVELLVRAAAVYVAVLFLPLALASLAWPAIAHWSRRLADTLAALVLGKVVIVAVLSLAAGALAGGTGSTPAGTPAADGRFSSVLAGAALLLLAAFAPWSLFRLLPFIEAGAVGHLEGLAGRARHRMAAPAKGLASAALRANAAGAAAAAVAGPIGVIGPVGGSKGGSGSRHGGLAGSLSGSMADGLPTKGSGGSTRRTGMRTGGGSDADDGSWSGWVPGSSIPMMEPNAAATEAWNDFSMEDYQAGLYDHELPARLASTWTGEDTGAQMAPPPPPSQPPSPAPPTMRPGARLPDGVTYVGPLAQASGTSGRHHLGRDAMGPVLLGHHLFDDEGDGS